MSLQRRVGLAYLIFSMACLGMYAIQAVVPSHYYAIMVGVTVLYGYTALKESVFGKVAQVAGLAALSFLCFLWSDGDGYFGMGAMVISFLLCVAHGFYQKRGGLKLAATVAVAAAIMAVGLGPSVVTFGWLMFNVLFSWGLWTTYKAIVERYRARERRVIEELEKINREYEVMNGAYRELIEDALRQLHD